MATTLQRVVRYTWYDYSPKERNYPPDKLLLLFFLKIHLAITTESPILTTKLTYSRLDQLFKTRTSPYPPRTQKQNYSLFVIRLKTQPIIITLVKECPSPLDQFHRKAFPRRQPNLRFPDTWKTAPPPSSRHQPKPDEPLTEFDSPAPLAKINVVLPPIPPPKATIFRKLPIRDSQ